VFTALILLAKKRTVSAIRIKRKRQIIIINKIPTLITILDS